MATYKCSVCGHTYTESEEDKSWDSLGEDWQCPTCGVEKSFFEPLISDEEKSTSAPVTPVPEKTTDINNYLNEWAKASDGKEAYFNDIQQMAKTGHSIVEPMKSLRPIITWDDIIIKGAQLHKMPLNEDEEVDIQTVIGRNAKQPLIIETPIYISHMSYGALSKEFKIAMAMGSAAAKTCICSGEGGILKEEMNNAYKYILEYVPNQYSITPEYLQKADAIEIKIGQSAKPGMGGHLPADKVTEEIAQVRGKKVGQDIHSPSSYPDIRNKEELKAKIDWLRAESKGRPIGVKIAAGNIEEDLDIITFANPDFITIDGRTGATGSALKHIKDNTSIPTLFALHRTKKYLESKHIKHIAIVITGGLRISPDFAKAIALGADAIALASAAMIAGGCQQYRICNTGNCPMGIATQDPELRKRIDIGIAAQRIANFLNVSTNDLKAFARLTGNRNIHDMSVDDLSTGNSEISNHTDISHY